MAIRAAFKGTDIEAGFSPVELILLMELADAQAVYTYSLPADEDITDQQYIMAMQDLMVRGFVEAAETEGEDQESAAGGFRLTGEAESLFSPMFQAAGVLEVISAWEGTLPVLIYKGRGSARTVSRWDGESGYIGITRLEAEDIGNWLEEAGFLPEQPFETINEAGKALLYDEVMQKKLVSVRESVICTGEEPPVLWSMQENVRCVLRLIRTYSGQVTEEEEPAAEAAAYVPGSLCAFFDTETESWILTEKSADIASDNVERQDTDAEEEWVIVPDSVEYRDKIWRKWL